MGRSNLRGTRPAGGYNLVEIDGRTMTFRERRPEGETRSPWHSLVLERHDFAADTNRYPRPDFSANSRYPNVKERWTVNTGWTIASTPAVWKDLAIVGDASGAVSAVSLKTGRVEWRFRAQNAVYSTPAVAGDRVVFASADGKVYALKAATGKEEWRFETSRPIVASPAITNGEVYLGSSEGKFRALDLWSGKLLWQFNGLGGFVETRPLLQDGNVLFGAWDEHLYALDAKSGKLLWKWQGDRRGVLLSPRRRAGLLPLRTRCLWWPPDRRMTALDVATGREIWRTGDYVVRESIGLSQDRRRFYVRAMNDFIYAFATAPAQPQQLWQTNAGLRIRHQLRDADGERWRCVLAARKNGLLIALDGKTGAVLWQHKVGTGVLNTVVPLSRQQVVVTDFDGKIALVEARN